MAIVITVRKISDRSDTAQIRKDDLPLWQKDGWEQYGVEEVREEANNPRITTATSTTTSSTPAPKVDTITLAVEFTEKEFAESLPTDVINAKLAGTLYRAGIRSKAQLRTCTDEKLLSVPGIGRAKVKDIRDAINS